MRAGLCGTSRDFTGLRGTSWDFAGLRGTSRDFAGLRRNSISTRNINRKDRNIEHLLSRNGRGERGGYDLLNVRLKSRGDPCFLRYYYSGFQKRNVEATRRAASPRISADTAAAGPPLGRRRWTAAASRPRMPRTRSTHFAYTCCALTCPAPAPSSPQSFTSAINYLRAVRARQVE